MSMNERCKHEQQNETRTLFSIQLIPVGMEDPWKGKEDGHNIHEPRASSG